MSSECLRATFLLPLLVTLLPLLVAAFSVWAHLRRPAWAGLPPAAQPVARRLLALSPYALVFGLVLGVCLWKLAPHWRMQTDEERDQLMAALCGTGRACPLVGNEMNRLRVQLGPLNRYLMTAAFVVHRDPRTTLVAIVVCHALAVAWAARLADSLFRAPAGLGVALLLGVHPVLMESYLQPSNGPWVTLPLVATVALTLRWLRGDGGVPLVGAVTALTCAMQLHGTAMELAPIVLALGVIYRPRTPRWALIASAAVVAVMYLPWLWFQFISDWSGFRAFSLGWVLGGSSSTAIPNGPPPGLGVRLLAPLKSVGPAALLLVPGMTALWPGRDAERRGLLAFALVPLAISLAGAAATGGLWADRYCVVFLPAVTLAALGWVRLAWQWLPRASWALVPVVPLACAGAAALSLRENPNPYDVDERSRTQVSLSEDIEATRVLASHGFRNQDLDHRVHGKPWARWTSARTYLGHWIIGPRSTPAPAEHALATECAVSDPAFARWQRALAPGPGVRHHLVGYRPALDPARLEVDLGDGPAWTLEDGVPFFMEQMHGGDSRLRGMVDPALAYPTAFGMLNTRWLQRRAGDARMRVVARLTRCEGERFVTLLLPRSHVPTFTVGGAARTPDERLEAVDEVRYRIHPTPAECAAAPIEIVAEIALPPMMSAPRRIDLYEEPYPACAGDR